MEIARGGKKAQAGVMDAMVFLIILSAAAIIPPTLMDTTESQYRTQNYELLQTRAPAALQTFLSATIRLPGGTDGNDNMDARDLLFSWWDTGDAEKERLLELHLRRCLIPGDHGMVRIAGRGLSRSIGETPPDRVDMASAETLLSAPDETLRITLLVWMP